MSDLEKRYSFHLQQDTAQKDLALVQDITRPPLRRQETVREKKDRLRTETPQNRFFLTTSAHGWNHIASEKHKVVKAIWLLIILVGMAANIFHVTLLVLQYLSYPTELKSEVQVEVANVDFPSVSICNIQAMSQTTKQQLLNNTSSKFYLWDNLTQNYLKDVAQDLNRYVSFLNQKGIFVKSRSDELELLYNRLRQPVGFFENIGDEAETVGHQPIDFIKDCTFGSDICTWDNFTFFQDPTYYNCYTFNGGNLSKPNLIVRTTGPQEGLSLVVYFENDNGDESYHDTYYTFSNVGNAAGMRLVIHSPNTKPHPMDHGIDIAPGQSASIGLEVRFMKRLDNPYGDCYSHGRKEYNSRYLYSSHTCLTLCQQFFVMDNCGCVSSFLPIPDMNLTNHHYCAQLVDTSKAGVEHFLNNVSCESDKMFDFAVNEGLREACECHPPCNEYFYKPEISYSYWPLDSTQKSFYETYIMGDPNFENLKAYQNLKHINITDMISRGLIRKNFARVNVYLKSLVIEEHLQKKSYEFPNLFSDIGGTFGLWIGMSIITWCEVGELFIVLINRRFNKTHKLQPKDAEKISNSHSFINQGAK